MTKQTRTIVILMVVALLALVTIIGYNSFVKLDEDVKVKWNEMQNSYQRRSDLIPSLVNVVKGSTEYEQTTLQQLAEARAKASQLQLTGADHDSYMKQEAAQAAVVNNLNKVIAVIEKYPDLQSNNAFSTLQAQLEGTERRIKFARKDFNEAVMQYNKKARSFPWNLIGSIFGFKVREGFKADGGTETAPEVRFN